MQLVHHRGIGKSLLMGLLGAIAGYVTLALASTLVQEIWLGGVSYLDSARVVLVLAGVFTPLCAVAGGLVGSLVAGRSRWHAAAILSALILAVCAATWLHGRYARGTGPKTADS